MFQQSTPVHGLVTYHNSITSGEHEALLLKPASWIADLCHEAKLDPELERPIHVTQKGSHKQHVDVGQQVHTGPQARIHLVVAEAPAFRSVAGPVCAASGCGHSRAFWSKVQEGLEAPNCS